MREKGAMPIPMRAFVEAGLGRGAGAVESGAACQVGGGLRRRRIKEACAMAVRGDPQWRKHLLGFWWKPRMRVLGGGRGICKNVPETENRQP